MASWLLGISKLKTDHIIENKDDNLPPATSTTEVAPENKFPAKPNLQYDLKPTNPSITSEQNVKPISVLDNIPFVLSSKINVNTNNYNCNLEDTKKYLLSVKNLLESDEYNYDFSNDRRLLNSTTMYSP